MSDDSFKKVTRGGQVLLHNLRMIGQVLNKVLIWSLPVWLFVAFIYFIITTHAYERYLIKQWVSAEINTFVDSEHHQQSIIQPDGTPIIVYSTQITEANFIQNALNKAVQNAESGLWIGFWIYLLNVIGVLFWLKKRGNEQSQPKFIKGDRLSAAKEIEKIMQKNKRLSNFIIGTERLPLPQYSEMQHYLFHGTTGSGKSTGIKEFLDFIRMRGDRAIIYDKSCTLVKQFYDDRSDILLNPMDKRGQDWSPWAECRDKADFENLAAAQIPMPLSTQDPFWVNAARTIFSVAAYRMRSEKNPKILTLLRNLLTADINALQELLKGTEAETLMSEKTEKTAISIKSVLATYLKSMCFIQDGDNPFSIRKWIQNDEGSSWLFISSLGDKHESLKPLITCWLDIAVNALLSLPENPNRRIWIVLDELTSLQQLPYLTTALSEARKFGGCFIVGIQSYAQLSKLYGTDGGKEISSLLNTRFMFRVPDPDIAHWSSKNLGEITLEEVREGISYGANTMRDGVSVNRSEREKPVVNSSEIMKLADLNCYVRIAGDYPIANVHFPYIGREDRNTAFELRAYDKDNLRENVISIADTLQTGTDKNNNAGQLSSDTSESSSNETASIKSNQSQKKLTEEEKEKIFG